MWYSKVTGRASHALVTDFQTFLTRVRVLWISVNNE